VDVTQESQFYFPGPLRKYGDNPMKPINIQGPDLVVVDGKIKLVDEEDTSGNPEDTSGNPVTLGLEVFQTYIYKREENDEIKN
ncbi:hypothetical protein, partial [Pseudoalteromonas sp. SG41-6]|uniref:hypothetical protein n=1 Tax=Pseudoalteromonas sp. SG41-6 TaxID=2760974 RepID=UPI00160036ED